MFLQRENGWTLLSLLFSLVIASLMLVLSIRSYASWQHRLAEQAIASDLKRLWQVAGDYFKMTGCEASSGKFAADEGRQHWGDVSMKINDSDIMIAHARLPWVRNYVLSITSESEPDVRGQLLRHYYLTITAENDTLSESALCALGARLDASTCMAHQLMWRRPIADVLPNLTENYGQFKSDVVSPSVYHCH